MRLAIMQPYLFPYIGYFQLINAADLFVLHDDVQYIKGGWINRNRILQNGKDVFITLSLKNDSAYKNINERFFSTEFVNEKKKILRVLQNAYHKAPHLEEVLSLLNKIFLSEENNISVFITQSILLIKDYLQITTPVQLSSAIPKNNETKGEERVLELCKSCNASQYINPTGGISLYSKINFYNNGIQLNFLRTNYIEYKQFENNFIPFLSIIDVLMFNSIENIKTYLAEFTLE